MEEKLLPLGSVVLLEGGAKPLMVTGYKMKDKEESEKIYDYVGCVFPEGFMEEIYSLFDHEQITDVMFVGYQDDEYKDAIYNITHGIIASSGGSNKSETKRVVRKPATRQPINPMSASEAFAKYTKVAISGRETEIYDPSKYEE